MNAVWLVNISALWGEPRLSYNCIIYINTQVSFKLYILKTPLPLE